jgi:hypothetical protein
MLLARRQGSRSAKFLERAMRHPFNKPALLRAAMI